MGHNDIDYEHKTNKELSFQFANATQNQLVIDALLWLTGRNSTDWYHLVNSLNNQVRRRDQYPDFIV